MPKLKQWILQTGLAERFKEAFGKRGRAGIEFPFRPHPEHELRVADVAWVSRERMNRTLDGDVLGAPEFIVEVLSPSNTSSEMLDKKHLCFQAGCDEFWIVDPRRAFIEVESRGGVLKVYRGSDRVPVGGVSFSVDEILHGDDSGE